MNKLDKFHNFPQSFDSHIINQGNYVEKLAGDGKGPYRVYKVEGNINGKSGVYELGGRPI